MKGYAPSTAHSGGGGGGEGGEGEGGGPKQVETVPETLVRVIPKEQTVAPFMT